MTSKIPTLLKIQGYAGRCNDVLYSYPTGPISREFLIFFGGDMQDTQENMKEHPDSKKYLEWNLENTIRILSDHFPKKHVLIVRPSRMSVTSSAVFSCYDNFVPSNKFGIPSFCPTYNALKHLEALLESSSKETQYSSLEKTDLTIMGFSKGCVVLNQLLHEFHYYLNTSETDTKINRFLDSIRNMWWLDGGHGGDKDTWITDPNILESFAKLRINVYIGVTPYQIRDSRRPWIRIEENSFYETLQKFGVSVRRTMHFEHKPRSLSVHFDILKAIGEA